MARYGHGLKHEDGSYALEPGWGDAKGIVFEGNQYIGRHVDRPEDAKGVERGSPAPQLDWNAPRFDPSKPDEFDALQQILGVKRQVFYVPGEHDTSVDDGKMYLQRYGKGTKGSGWYSYDHKGVHFIALVNVAQLEGMGSLGAEQLAWLKRDVAGLRSSTPIVVFAHIPLWAIYPDWGWGTADSEQALALLKRFGSVTVLNGHIHQVMQKVEGNVAFHTAMSTAFPQPAPGAAPSPGPMKVPADKLRDVLGIRQVDFVAQRHELAVVDATLSGAAVVEQKVKA